jgi:uncharacterized surface anchored protein
VATSLSCTTAGTGVNAGKCSINTVPFGQYWVVETTVPSGFAKAADQNVVISAATPTASLSFDDLPQKGSLTVHKEDDGGNLMNGVTFTLTGTSTGGESVNLSCTTGPPPASEANGECTISNIPVGSNYTLSEGSVPAGYTGDPSFPKTVAITSNTTTTVNVTNPRLHRAIVLVCHEGTDTLYSVDVVNGTSTKQSLGSLPTSLTDKGVTQAEICGLGGASFGGLGHGNKSLTAQIVAHP